MAGHSHASNIKHKKGRNDRAKSEFFLRVRKKIELAYNSTNDKEKIFSMAREHNFPREKVNSVIEKIEKSRHQSNTFVELLCRGRYEIVVYLRGSLSAQQEDLLEENMKILSLEKLYSKRPQDYFCSMYLLRIDTSGNMEEIVLSSLPTLVVDKIIKIEKKGERDNSEFGIFFSEKGALTETIELFTNYPGIHRLESEEVFSSFSSVHIDSDDFFAYFSLLKNNLSTLAENLQVFTNISDRKKWDHSSVG